MDLPNQDRCEKNPSLPKAYCSHCQGLPKGTNENPRFTLRADDSGDYPLVELLKNGGPMHPYDSRFCFGKRKAMMLVSCVDLLKEFWQARDEQRLTFEPRVVSERKYNLHFRVYVEMKSFFEHSSGQIVDKPYLQLEALPPYDDRIGVGATKCRAICEVESQLREWIARQKGVLEYEF